MTPFFMLYYQPDNKERICMTLAAPTMDELIERNLQLRGGRPIIVGREPQYAQLLAYINWAMWPRKL
jgi:hypothetical protein